MRYSAPVTLTSKDVNPLDLATPPRFQDLMETAPASARSSVAPSRDSAVVRETGMDVSSLIFASPCLYQGTIFSSCAPITAALSADRTKHTVRLPLMIWDATVLAPVFQNIRLVHRFSAKFFVCWFTKELVLLQI